MIDKGRVHRGPQGLLPTEKSDCASDFTSAHREHFISLFISQGITQGESPLFFGLLGLWSLHSVIQIYHSDMSMLLTHTLTTGHQPVQPHSAAVDH